MDKMFQSDVANIVSELAEIQKLCPPHYTPAAWLEILRLCEIRKQTTYLRSIADLLERQRYVQIAESLAVSPSADHPSGSDPVGMAQAVANQSRATVTLKGKR
jgi:hypothetical protein